MSQRTKNKFRSLSIDTPTNKLTTSKQKVHINILLENSSYNIIGFVIIKQEDGESLTLCNLRNNIKLQFDEDQLQLLGSGDTFKFIMDKIPISTKQETLVHIQEIIISDQKAMQLMQETDKIVTIHGSDTSDDDDDFDYDTPVKSNLTTRPLSAPHTRHLSAPNTRHNSEDILYERAPHHYQYIPSPTYLVVPSTPDSRSLRARDKSPRKKRIRSHTQTSGGLLSPFQLSPRIKTKTKTKTIKKSYNINKRNKNKHIIYYSIVVRSSTTRHSYRTLPFTSSQGSHKNTDTSMSIFTRINVTAMDMEHNEISSETDAEPSISSATSETTIDSRHSNIYHAETKLERLFGGKLPRIKTARTPTTKGMQTDHITHILRKALVNHDEFKLKPMKSLRMKPSYTRLDMHMDDYDAMEQYENYNYTQIYHDRCRFTVIGSPLNNHNNHNNNNKKQRMWIFYDPSELMLGLQGVHHSDDNPVWMDLVCDEDTFVMISEHIKPAIHSLTIEDCVTSAADGREKLELFDNYLFICIDTDVESDKICMIVFKNMIITYHKYKNKTSDIVITEARNHLEKRHHRACPTNIGWVCHAIIDVIVDRMMPEIECRVQEVTNVENLVFSLSGSSHQELLQRLQIARNWLIVYRSRLWTKSTMTYNLQQTHWRNEFLSGVQQQFWNDINDHVARMVDLLSAGQLTLEFAQNIFVAKLSLEMSEQADSLSNGASRLTAVGSIFLPLSFLSAVWGMNCKVPFQYEGPPDPDSDESTTWSDDHFGYVIIFTFMVLVGTFTYRYHIKYS